MQLWKFHRDEAPLEVPFDAEAFFQDQLNILGFPSGLVVCVADGHFGECDEFDKTDEADDSDINESASLETRHKRDKAQSKIQLSHFSIKE